MLMTECGAKVQQSQRQSQGNAMREVRIYTIKNKVKYLRDLKFFLYKAADGQAVYTKDTPNSGIGHSLVQQLLDTFFLSSCTS